MKQRQTNNGSLRKRETTQPQQHIEYYLFNSQGNLKAYSDDIMDFAYYGYNAANTRAYKISLYNTNLWINGQQQPLHLQLQQAMFYPNTYLNFDAFGNYTKHYYNGMERVASRLGDNTTTIALNNNILEARKLQLEEQFREDIHKLIEETVPIDLPPFIDVNALQPTGTPNDIYYYHPNHLGNTAFVTDQNQNITQGFLYAPFGEITTEYNVNFGNNTIPKYSFNAKELDEETGMYYYEARYYKPPVFTSRDPMFEKYFWMTPYAYFANNPVKYVDPSGEEMWEPEVTKDGKVNYVAEKGDNMRTFREQYGLDAKTAGTILGKSGITKNEQIVAGKTTISGETVKSVTGSEVLKMDLNSEISTKQRKTDQFMFGLKYSQVKELNLYNIKSFFKNINSKDFMCNLSDVTVSIGEGKRIPIKNISIGLFDYLKMSNGINGSHQIPGTDDFIIYFRTSKDGKNERDAVMFRINKSDIDAFYEYY